MCKGRVGSDIHYVNCITQNSNAQNIIDYGSNNSYVIGLEHINTRAVNVVRINKLQ